MGSQASPFWVRMARDSPREVAFTKTSFNVRRCMQSPEAPERPKKSYMQIVTKCCNGTECCEAIDVTKLEGPSLQSAGRGLRVHALLKFTPAAAAPCG